MFTPEERKVRAEARKEARKEAKDQARIKEEREQKPVDRFTISIEWVRSRTWGRNPKASVDVWFKDGSFKRLDGFTCSGCGYCKESTVIAQVFNSLLRYKLWALTPEQIKGGHGSLDKGAAPYGISNYSPAHRSFAGGIGVSCYTSISEYIGGKFERVASGKTFDAYNYTDRK